MVGTFIVGFLLGDGSNRRQLAAFATTGARDTFVAFLQSENATRFGDWYQLPTNGSVNSGIQRALDLGGNCWDLHDARKAGNKFFGHHLLTTRKIDSDPQLVFPRTYHRPSSCLRMK